MASLREYEMLFQLNAQLDGGYNSTFKAAQSQIASMQKEIDAFNKVQSKITAYEKQQSAIEGTKKKLEVLQQQYDNIQKEISETGEYSSTLANKLLAKQQQIDKTNVSIQAQTEKLGQMKNALHAAGINTDALTEENAKLGNQMDVLKQKQVEVAEKASSFGSKASAAFMEINQAIAAAGITVALKEIYDGFMSTADASIKFESGITGVDKTTDLTKRELAELAQGIKDLSGDIPVATGELNEITEAAGQLGIAQDHLLDFSEVMANLGVATNLSAMDASTALAKFANITKMSADDYERLGSTIVGLGNKSASTESEIVSMATRLASTGSIIGLSEPEIMAVSAALSSLGIEAEAGGSAISKLLKDFEVMVQTGAPGLKNFAKVAGMSADEFSVAWGKNSVEALGKFIDGLGRIEADGGSAVATLEDLGITEIRMSNAVLALASSGGMLSDSLKTANAAWKDNTALTVEAEKRYATTESQLKMMQNEYDNLKIAIGDNYTPVLKESYEVGNQVLSGITSFIQKHPELVQAVTAFTGIIGLAAAGITAYAVAVKIAGAATALFSATIPGINVIMGVTLAVAALTAGSFLLAKATKTEQEELAELTATSREQYRQMKESEAEYKEVSDAMGETSYEAQVLKHKLDDATKAYEENKRTAKEMAEEHEAVINTHKELMEAYDDTIKGVEGESLSNVNLMNKLEELMSVEGKTAAAKQEILTIVEMLNEAVPELGLHYDEYKDSLNMTADALEKIIEAEIVRDKYKANKDQLKKFKEDEIKLQKLLNESKEETTARVRELSKAQEDLSKIQEQGAKLTDVGKSDLGRAYAPYIDAVNKAKSAVNDATETEKEAQAQYSENKKKIEEITSAMAGYSEEVAGKGGEVQKAITNITEKVSDLAKKYDEAYKVALDSLEGQYSLWDNVAASVATSSSKINSAMGSQIDYWKKYNDNLANLTNRSADIKGLSDMLASFADGSAGSVNAIAGMAKASDKDLAAMVKNWQKLRDEQETVAAKLTDLQTDFQTSMNVLQKELETTIGKMSLGDEAAQSGKNTIQGFIDGAKNMTPEVQAAYKKLADAAMEALAGSTSTAPTINVGGGNPYAVHGSHAEGLDYVPFDGYIAELHKGERVLTAEEASMTRGTNAISAQYGGAVSISLDYSPQYEVKGENVNEIKSVLQEHDNNLRDFILDVLESAGIDAARRAYV
ncbi:MAG: phage tail tape measure protein [Eubacterium sp.]|jgi:TP901 family phage tail tape measure protein|nr:phage tail tape measure protein [Eubacterium sp.]